ncbi:MAG: STAS/SEC14 domain-containing protein [Bradymonadaceae bacterium]|nr:STAS/SEC14 domain-containing protein [Lujinxingiaceae bacterium]
MYELENPKNGDFVIVTINGRLGEDVDRVASRLEKVFDAHDKVNLLIKLEDIEGVDADTLWKNLKLTAKHFDEIERFGVVGDSEMIEWMARISKPITSADVRHFDVDEVGEAERWVRGKG